MVRDAPRVRPITPRLNISGGLGSHAQSQVQRVSRDTAATGRDDLMGGGWWWPGGGWLMWPAGCCVTAVTVEQKLAAVSADSRCERDHEPI